MDRIKNFLKGLDFASNNYEGTFTAVSKDDTPGVFHRPQPPPPSLLSFNAIMNSRVKVQESAFTLSKSSLWVKVNAGTELYLFSNSPFTSWQAASNSKIHFCFWSPSAKWVEESITSYQRQMYKLSGVKDWISHRDLWKSGQKQFQLSYSFVHVNVFCLVSMTLSPLSQNICSKQLHRLNLLMQYL